MTKANKKRIKRGDPLKYKSHVDNSKFFYTLDDKTFYKARKEEVTREKNKYF